MSDGTKIEWTDATWNPITGCSVVSAGCRHCYAMKLAGTRLQHHPSRAGLTIDTKEGPVWTGEVRFNKQWLQQPLQWRRPRRIFVCAHSDLFHENVKTAWIEHVLTVTAHAKHHVFQILTKRPGRMREIMQRWTDMNGRPQPNLWLGVSIEDQAAVDERIPLLLQTPAAVRWISAEPLLGAVDLSEFFGVENADHESRGNCLLSRDGRRTDDRPIGSNLAGWGEARESMDGRNNPDSMPAASSRENEPGVPSGPCDVRVSPSRCDGAQTGMATLLRTDSGRHDGESQKWHQDGKRANESGIGDDLRSSITRDPSSRVEAGAKFSWVVVGGESGPNARLMVLGWAKDIVRQCQAAGVPVLMKQVGANPTNREGQPHKISDRKGAIMAEWPKELRIREYPEVQP